MANLHYFEPTVQYKEIPLTFKPTVQGRIDKNTYLDYLANLSTGIPSGVRNTGYLYWVNDKSTFYVFNGGILDMFFVPLATLLTSGITKQYTMSNVSLTVGQNYIQHNLGTSSYLCNFYIGNQNATFAYSKGDGSGNNTANILTIESSGTVTVNILFTFSI